MPEQLDAARGGTSTRYRRRTHLGVLSWLSSSEEDRAFPTPLPHLTRNRLRKELFPGTKATAAELLVVTDGAIRRLPDANQRLDSRLYVAGTDDEILQLTAPDYLVAVSALQQAITDIPRVETERLDIELAAARSSQALGDRALRLVGGELGDPREVMLHERRYDRVVQLVDLIDQHGSADREEIENALHEDELRHRRFVQATLGWYRYRQSERVGKSGLSRLFDYLEGSKPLWGICDPRQLWRIKRDVQALQGFMADEYRRYPEVDQLSHLWGLSADPETLHATLVHVEALPDWKKKLMFGHNSSGHDCHYDEGTPDKAVV